MSGGETGAATAPAPRYTLLLHPPAPAPEAWRREFAAALPEAAITLWPDVGAPPDYAAVWKPPAALFDHCRSAKAIFNLGAGVDALLATPGLPATTPIFRLEDAGMAGQMAEYVALAVLSAYREAESYAEQQRAGIWQPRRRIAKEDFRVGILGLGVLGQAVAAALLPFGFPVAGWSRDRKSVPGVASFAGRGELGAFLAGTRVLVCLLPATAETCDLLDAATLSLLPHGAEIVNVARGSVLVDADLIALLDSGHLARATLDVFRDEPLPPAHPFWHHPRVTITPHASAVTGIEASVAQVAANLRRFEDGLPVGGRVDRNKGY